MSGFSILVSVGLTVCAAASPFPQDPPLPSYPFPSSLTSPSSKSRPCAWTGVLLQSVAYTTGGQYLRVVRNVSEDCTESTEWEQVSGRYTTSLRISAVAARQGGDTVYVAGLTDDGQDVIEEWTFDPPDGQWILRAPTSPPPPLGVAMGPFVPTLAVQGGGSYSPPPDRTYVTPTIRTVIRRGHPEGPGSPLGHVRSMDADPEGRFLVLLTDTPRKVLRLDLVGPATGTFTTLLESNSTPELVGATRLGFWEHVNGTRMLFVDLDGDDLTSVSRIVLSDSENDGSFESVQPYSRNDWMAASYADSSVWKRLYWAACPP